MGKGWLCEEFEKGVTLDAHLVGNFGVYFRDFPVEVCALFRLFLFEFRFGWDRLSSEKSFLFLFPVVFELKPLKFVGKEAFHELE